MRLFKGISGGNIKILCEILSSYLFLISAFLLLGLSAETTFAQDWVLTGTQVVENDSIVLDGNLIVENGGNLTLRAVTLTMNNSYNGEYGIRVKSGGVITIESATLITAASDSARFSFAVESGAGFLMRNSELNRCGWGSDSDVLLDNATIFSGIRGLTVDTSDAVIEGNTLCNNHVGIILTGSGINFDSNNIHSNNVHGIYIYGGSTCKITNNSIQHSTISSPFRIVEGQDNIIRGNSITLSEIHRGVIETMWSHGNVIEENNISGMGMGILMMAASNNNLVKNNDISTDEAGITIWGWNNRVEGNTISDSSKHPTTGIYMVYAYNSKIIDNNITGDTGEGIWLRHSSNNTIVNNQIRASTSVEQERENGLLLMYSSKRNVIHGNSISGFPRAISLFYSSDENTITGNDISGLTLQTAILDDSSDNLIYNNNFLDMGLAPYDNGQNQWDYGGRGNYWSEYGGSDTNGDGIGDEPYTVGPEVKDHYPVMSPIEIGTLPVPEADLAKPPNPGEVFGKTVTGVEVIENQTIMLGDLGVASGGSLTLRNVTLITGGSKRCSNLYVDSGGSLSIDNCEIILLEYGYGFQMRPPKGATFSMKDSVLQGCGHEWPYGGLLIRSDNAIIENNEISDTIISFFDTSGGRVVKNTISRSYWTINLEGADNTTIADNIISKSIHKVIFGSGSGQTIKNNIITDFWGDGILTWQSPDNIAEGNYISGGKANVPAIFLGGLNATIKGNTVTKCATGIRTDLDTKTVTGNKISNCSVGLDMRWNNSHAEDNEISNCTVGIYILGSGHTFVGNVVSGCDTGVTLTLGSSGNVFYHNNFINNTLQAEDPWKNQWDYNGQGNYWSDYLGDDNDGDDIGDIPYYLELNGVDNYPLVLPIGIIEAQAASIYFPHVSSNVTWETEVCIINSGDNQTLNGVFKAYNHTGTHVSEDIVVTLAPHGRREITVGDEFSSPADIGYIIFESDSDTIAGYTKFYIEGKYRVAVPAVKEVNTRDIYVSHIASNADWWTGVSLVNTTFSSRQLTWTFDNGMTQTTSLAPKEHKAFTISSLFNGQVPSDVHSAVITGGNGVVGLELFGSTDNTGNDYLSGVLLKDATTTKMYYPHVASNSDWWTGIVGYNPSSTACTITVQPYTQDGTSLSPQTLSLAGKSKYIGTASDLQLPTGTAWFEIDASSPITGFELFGTNDGKELGGYTGVGTSGTNGIFAKLEPNGGWTGIAFVNIDNSSATVTITAHNDSGEVIAEETVALNAHEKMVGLAPKLFSQDISNATFITYSSTGNVVGFQLNGSSDDMMLDGLPGLR